MLIESFHSGRRGQRRYCSLHRPATRLVRSMGVVLCAPLGHEYYRSHRAYVKLADQLAQLGFPVMRFDHFGSGDSDGDTGHDDLDAWLNDVAETVEELRRSEPVTSIALGGLRFGATLAMLAARRIDAVRALVLWDPVDDGKRYCEELAALHARMLGDLERFPRRRDRDAATDGEYVGTRYGRLLFRQIGTLETERFHDLDVDDTVLVTTAGAPGDSPAIQSWKESTRLHACRVPLDYGWQDERRIEEAIVDTAAVRHVASSLSGITT